MPENVTSIIRHEFEFPLNMRVLYWTELFWPHIGGAEVWGGHFISGLRRRGYEFRVVTRLDSPAWPEVEVYDDTPVHRFPFWDALDQRDPRLVHRLLGEVRRLQDDFAPNIVHLNTAGPSLFFYLALRKTAPTPALLSLHGPVPYQTGPDTIPGQAMRSVHWVTANSFAMLREIRRLVPEVKDHSSCIHYGLAAAPGPTHRKEPLRRLLCLGRLIREKGFDLALAAMPQIVERFPDVSLVIAGDGPARADLERQAAALGLNRWVDFIGRVEPRRVPELIGSAQMVIIPSRWLEAFGLVALEAARMGRPVVAARVGGLPEIVRHERTGLLVPKENVGHLARAIAFLLERPGLASRMGRAARHRARMVFSQEKSLDAYVALYENLTSN